MSFCRSELPSGQIFLWLPYAQRNYFSPPLHPPHSTGLLVVNSLRLLIWKCICYLHFCKIIMLFVTFWLIGFFFYGFKHTVLLFCALLFLMGSQLAFVSVFSYIHITMYLLSGPILSLFSLPLNFEFFTFEFDYYVPVWFSIVFILPLVHWTS